MSKKYFFFDIDGTLLSETDKKIPLSCKQTLVELKKRGHFVAIATSRPYILTYEEAKALNIENYVCDGGDGLVINNQIIEILPLVLEDAKALAKEAIEHQIPIATSIDTTNNRYSPDDTFINHYPNLKDAFDFVTLPGFDVLKANAIHKMCIYIQQEDEHLLPTLHKVPHYRIDEHCILVEAIDKYHGIKKMMKYLNAPEKDVVVFGDGRNDLSMFRQAPFSIAMGNAISELKEIASYVTEKASEDGIFHACEHFGWSNIRNANPNDLDTVTKIESICFPSAEAASKSSIEKRIEAFSDCFWVLEKDHHIVGFVNGMATDQPYLFDEMYDNANMHQKNGKWQMIFSLAVLPDYQHQKIARTLLNTAIEDAKNNHRLGVVLTCKERLIHYYESFGFVNEGISNSVHGNTVWYDMRLTF